MKNEERIQVKITTSRNWYKKGQIHEVGNYVTFDFAGNDPCFEKGQGTYGIHVSDCEILIPVPLPEYTIDELIKKVGHKFILKDE